MLSGQACQGVGIPAGPFGVAQNNQRERRTLASRSCGVVTRRRGDDPGGSLSHRTPGIVVAAVPGSHRDG